ncbi:MAG TPA: ABC transporter substrate-binding protein, partial [Acidimicrobiales bacterium]|nr:ABC transporter substrate-binding protein [Acidimicrobiales bacterium]
MTTARGDAGRGAWTTAVLAAIVLVAGLARMAGAEAPKTWTLDVLSPTTGRGAAYAIDYVLGMNIAAKEMNAAKGINGKPVELVFHDTQTDITQAVS